MNNQQKIHFLKASVNLSTMVSAMSFDEKKQTAEIIRDCDIARLMKNSTIQKELKAQRSKHKGKIKLFLTALSRNPYAETGVNALFKRAQVMHHDAS